MALVSGGNRGLGLQIVRGLAERGMRVAMGSRSVERGRLAVELLGDLAERVVVRQLDVTDPASVDRLAGWLRARLGRCDVLVNNAAVLRGDDRGAADVDLAAVRDTLEINLLGTWRLTQAVAPLMRIHRYGRIVNVSSRPGNLTVTRPESAAYGVSKHAVNALTRMLADEFAADGILVNACIPEPLRVVDRDDTGAVRVAGSPDTPVWLATLPDEGPTGGLFRDGAPVDW
ncbi:SDR family oxidoreductase [Dactylosporangium fulvum]|uniref:SDR family NAD(P)-dependent oxidoreductase n=1 Tax=Dactylosporangium fulvum TaxID=53359 RepID=A0ABY5VTK6_9ACTN|nr:SDR family NAD(P)-dependent oxidoreductase [Dactylosporangium fulvum]UWP80161.1 SDR family NAD(P)-dependent oxidoreductase [Dactylosporangium fulvum]